ncbi:23S rRNA (uracil(1939)-C(5))-methyltransferase RlmD [Neobacillus thermocopriae]|uniref:23S rRNA (Uracil(1939)-C(5))-methyltransferase RlmD n=1 Tax=Neobacillus thermocopriae TaxID=1215031 RepID=A0A6B3TLI2_9BACI|nr:23S rRNA (uracil(1939)-C(5))-methyltransferase RlmD [Neobacillus thermocopriae]MED3622655.1 23S rRNA (uracil(1939)-C(5))-methyltransferase RlmD [Neobacillus thermocopriae]MED3714255.1 23S rRNA (uracil(1939)-C(5))-methyltransferase RlmD [Neobacillus thermocopriae]NEX77794.1 23S rRNA (uracil(1939)-C(5))-methyltransferase RlmD [Neobacillus thermocopriae]
MSRTLPVNKNDYIDVEFTDLTHDGMGVAKYEGYPIFVSNGLPGEKAKVKVIKTGKSYGVGRLIELYERSPYRVDISRDEKHKYGGCQLEHLNYKGQLKYKENQVRQVLSRIGKLEDVVIHPILGMEEPLYYRNKAQVPVGEKDGKLIAGFFKPRSHEIVDTDESVIQLPEVNEAIQVVKEICRELRIPAYNEEAHKGVLRHIMARYGKQTGELMVVLITRTEEIPNKNRLVKEIVARLPKVKSIVHNVNAKRTNVILGEKTKVLWGNDVIYDYIGDVKFAISTLSFYQVNPVQTKVLYEKALEYADLSGEENVIDAYCGIGTISLFLAQKARKVFGVEVVKEAIEDARKNAALNGMTNVEFAVGEAEVVIPKWYKEGNTADVLVVDPPRKGCDAALLQTIIDMKPKKVVYVSCNPATLARDLRILEDGGYKTMEVQPVDMFPMTTHVECVAQLIIK